MRIRAGIIAALLALGVLGGTHASAQQVCVFASVSVTVNGDTIIDDGINDGEGGPVCLPE